MQLLELMIREPRGPTRLAQAANLNYQKCDESLAVLVANQLADRDVQDGHEVYSATLKGKTLFIRWNEIFEGLNLP
jgi:predicted transcriptional regulator